MMSKILIFVLICICGSESLISNNLFGDGNSIDEEGKICDGTCQIAITCYFNGGKVDTVGNCQSLFQVCCKTINGDNDSDTDEFNHRNDIAVEETVSFGPVHSDPHCGRPAIANRRVVGGKEAGFGAFPWQALVRIGATRCGGALISRQHVVTAGHCVHSLVEKFGSFPPSGIKVFLGEYSLNGDVEPLPRQAFAVTSIDIHPNYEFTLQADRYDVAVLKLSRKVKYEPHILPICLPEKNQDVEVDSVAIVAGWGSMDPDYPKRPMELQAVDVKVVDSQICEKWHHKNNIDIRIWSDMLCAGFEQGGKDACQGDSGGPLMNKDIFLGRWTLVGIVSAGFSCAKPGQPGIYHRVSKSADWITYCTEKS